MGAQFTEQNVDMIGCEYEPYRDEGPTGESRTNEGQRNSRVKLVHEIRTRLAVD